uniref:Uncharacterized protein n=1 Tax=Stomoxys calcitrans TaxID=35570 RepID=A0A1I8Q586_STOCA
MALKTTSPTRYANNTFEMDYFYITDIWITQNVEPKHEWNYDNGYLNFDDVDGVETYNCIKIDYFSKEGYHPDPHDSASAIPYTVTKSCPFFLASGIVLLLSFIVFLIPTCSHQNNLYYFSAGIMFIVSGLLMLIGLIAYISILKAEIGSKLRPRSSLQPPMFKVTYGQSFFLFVFGFIATEFVGLLNIFLYISLQEVGYYSRLPCFSISNLQEKIREGENRHNYHKKNTYKSYKHEMDKKPIDRKRHSQQNKKHQVRAQELELDTKKLLKNMSQMSRVEAVAAAASGRRIPTDIFDKFTDVPYACRKHPNGLGSTMYLNELERRYYFEKSTGQPGTLANKCYLHSKNLAKSLNELYLESTLPPPPPSTIRMGGAGGLQQQKQQRQQQLHQLQIQTLPRPPQQFSDPPQEFPLTRSVSTTTEIYATHHNVSFADDLSENQTAIATATAKSSNKTSSASQEQRNNGGNRRRNVATNTMYANNSDTETQTNVVDGNHHQQQQQQQQLYNTRKFLQQQQLQHNRADGKNQHRLVHHGGDDDDARRRENANGDHHNGVEEDIDADEEQPQKLCGLRRGIRKTKDELFEEFCKRAGVRPKPKNIYYIENDDDVEEVDVADADASDERHKTSRSKNNNPRLLEAAPRKFHGNQSEFRVGSKSRENNRSYLAAGGVLDGNVTNGPNDDVGLTPNINGSRAGHDDDGDDAADSLLTATLGGNGGDHDDEDDDEHGFKKLTENEDHLYVIDDNIHLMPPSAAIRNGRRASMYVEPNHMRRLNSNLSLHALYAPLPVQNGLYDYESPTAATSSNYAGFATVPGTHYAMTRDVYGGSQNRLHQQHYHHADYHQQQQQQQQQQYQLQSMYQSRTTLPRTLVKRNADSQDSIASAVSASQLHNLYSSSGSQQRLTTLMMQHQQQQLQMQQNRYLSLSREQEVYNSRYGLHKSNEELNRQYIHPQQQQPIYLQMPHQMQYTQQPPPPQQSSTLKQQHQQPMVQWPTAIPSSPNSLRLYGGVGGGGGGGGAGGGIGGPSAAVVSSQNGNHAILTRSQSGGGNGTVGANGPSKFQRAYAFDEQRRPSVMVGDAFDLEEIERERRRSHASLFAGMTAMGGGGGGSGGSPVMKTNGPALASVSIAVGGTGVGVMGPQKSNNTNRDHYDMINGTAV